MTLCCIQARENKPMMMNTTLEQLRELKLNGMAAGLHDQLSSTGMNGLSFEERMALLVEREVHWRSDKKRERLMKDAPAVKPILDARDDDALGLALAQHGIERVCHAASS